MKSKNPKASCLEVEDVIIQYPVHIDVGLLLAILARLFAHCVVVRHHTRLGELLLRENPRLLDASLVGLEIVEIAGQDLKPGLRVVVAIEPEPCVAWVVEVLVKIAELLVEQVRDVPWVSTRVHPVGDIGEKGLLAHPAKDRVGGGVHPLHLVEHDALVLKLGGIWSIKLVVPALLLEYLLAALRVGLLHASRVED